MYTGEHRISIVHVPIIWFLLERTTSENFDHVQLITSEVWRLLQWLRKWGRSTFSCVTNPHCFSADGVTFLGTSGQNVDDVWR